ncbi:AAA family ATPase [bacterium]|nr:AAA family ATPase [bacterium]
MTKINKKAFQDYGIDLPMDATGQHYTTCPKCSHTRKKSNIKCLGIDADRKIWNCSHCSWSGSLSYKTESKPVISSRKPKPQPIKIDCPPDDELPEKAIKYFAERGILKHTLKAYDVQYIQNTYFPQINKKVSAICFLIKRNGKVKNVKFRSANKYFKQIKGGEKILFGMDLVPDYLTDFLILTEGEIDTLSIHEAGLEFVVSVPDGAPSTKSENFNLKFSYIESCKEFLHGFDKYILAVDNDGPGKILERELARRLGPERCYSVTWPDGCKDANDVLVKFGKDGIDRLIGSAKLFDRQLLEDSEPQGKVEFPGHYIEDIITDNTPPPLYIIENILPVQSILLISAPPKSFKTMLALNLAICLAFGKSLHDFKIFHQQKVFYCQAEMAYFATRDQRLKPMMQRSFAAPKNWLFITDRMAFNILDDKNFEKLSRWLQHFDVAFFDPFISYHNADENKNDAMQRVMERFRELTTLCNISIILVHHSRKAFDGYGGSNTRGASAIFGAVDSYIELKKFDTASIKINFDLRYGAQIENVTYKLNPSTLWLEKLSTTNTDTDRNKKICTLVQESSGSLTNSEIKKKIETEYKVSNNTASKWVQSLLKSGRLKSDGKKRNPTISLPEKGGNR